MSSTMSRRALLRGAAGLFGALSVSSLLAACGAPAPAAKPAETKPTETKPAEAAKPAAPAAQPAATTAPAPAAAATDQRPAHAGVDRERCGGAAVRSTEQTSTDAAQSPVRQLHVLQRRDAAIREADDGRHRLRQDTSMCD